MKKVKGRAAFLAPMIIKLVFGVMLIMDYNKVFDLIMSIAGGICLIFAIVNLVKYFTDDNKPAGAITSAVILGILGLVFFFAGGAIINAISNFLTILLGVILLFVALGQLSIFLNARKLGMNPGVMQTVSMVVLFALAIFAILFYKSASKTIWIAIGVVLCINAVLDIVSFFKFTDSPFNSDGSIDGSARDV
ncbi:MAG: DUF308 domain-containing protein [Lachnospiraceae bacterium]|nr:DUF308 domain-containing protein [Lachnospiraceae bacterium]